MALSHFSSAIWQNPRLKTFDVSDVLKKEGVFQATATPAIIAMVRDDGGMMTLFYLSVNAATYTSLSPKSVNFSVKKKLKIKVKSVFSMLPLKTSSSCGLDSGMLHQPS